MKKILLSSLAILLSSFLPSYALETTGTITTQSSGLNISLPCNPISVTNGSVDANTCAITCDTNYTLNGLSCNLNFSGGGGGGGSSSSSGGSNSIIPTETEENIVETGNNTIIPTETEENIIEVGSNLNTEISGQSENDTITNEGLCTFPGLTPVYTDIDSSWARSYIRDLSKRGIMNGVDSTSTNPGGAFEPERVVTRAEFLKIAMRSFCYEYSDLGGVENFEDVVDGSWVAQVTELAGSLNVIDMMNSEFRPNDPISKIEATKIILRIGETRSSNFAVDETVSDSGFIDVTIPWMMKYAAKAFELDIISGKSGNFEPILAIDRAQAAKISVRSMNAQ